MNKLYFFILALVFGALTFQLSSCKKPLLFSKGNLSFSRDTVVFDTVFTTVGSTTQQFKFFNNDNRTVVVEQIELMGGMNSPYRINVDGLAGTNFTDISIEGNDSLYVFVEVTLDPNSGITPMVVEDSIRFRTNGVDQYVQLAAWGQDAYFHYSYISEGIFDLNSGTWPNDKPHVIYGAAFVDSAETLNIQAGTQIYLHKNAILYNYKGTLNINGSYGNEVTLQGDRLEAIYSDVTAQYYGIYMQEPRESTIDYAIIKNGTTGIHVFSEDPTNTGYTVNVYNTIIENCASYGMWIYSGAKVKAENTIIAKCGVHSLLVLEGGDFNFNHCHLLGYGTGDGVGSAVGISNHYTRPDPSNGNLLTTFLGSINEGTITNSVIYGNVDHELSLDTISDVAITLNFSFRNNLIKSDDIFIEPFYVNNIWNDDPLFVDIPNNDFLWFSTSPLDGAADPSIIITNPSTSNADIRGIGRTGVDIGAYEFL